MSRSTRFDSLAAARNWTPPANSPSDGDRRQRSVNVEEIFGENTFGLSEMRARLPKAAYKALCATIGNGTALDPTLADVVAIAMKEWALERGVSHYTHWFQPLTGLTAEKHDSFITPNEGGGAMVTRDDPHEQCARADRALRRLSSARNPRTTGRRRETAPA